MVLGVIAKGIQLGFRYRKQIYRIISAQDRYIDKSMRLGDYGRQARWGVRHGATVGSIVSSYINTVAEDTPGNAIQKKLQQPKTSKPYKARSRRPSGYNRRDNCDPRFDKNCRRSSNRKYYQRRNR